MAENIFATHMQQPIAVNLNDALNVIPDNRSYTATSVYGETSEIESQISSAYPMDPELEAKKKPYVQIIEQPQPRALRFRYQCEGRSAGSIPGVNSTADNKTFPTIKIVGYKGPAFVVVSCVTETFPYKAHPHNLVGREGCRDGVCTMKINNDSMECMFSNLGIQCIKRKDVEEALKARAAMRVDPFRTGFAHQAHPQDINLNVVRLCFQVFLEDKEKGKFTRDLTPVVSDPIYDKKAVADLTICKLSDCTSTVQGGKEIILLCEKVNKDDIKVRFFEMKDGVVVWEDFGEFQASDIHKQLAISFRTPKYKSQDIDNSISVNIQLVRPSDQSASEPRPFEYLPLDSDPGYLKKKNKYICLANDRRYNHFIQGEYGQGSADGEIKRKIMHPNRSNPRHVEGVKIEPQDPLGLSQSPEMGTLMKPFQTHSSSGGGIVFPLGNNPYSQSSLYFPMNASHMAVPHLPDMMSQSPNLERPPFPTNQPGMVFTPHASPSAMPNEHPLMNIQGTLEAPPVEMESTKRDSAMDSDLRKINSSELVRLDSNLIVDFQNSLSLSGQMPSHNELNASPMQANPDPSFPANIPPSENANANDCIKDLVRQLETYSKS